MFNLKMNRSEENFVEDQLLKECRVMAEHALGSGAVVPSTYIQAIDEFARRRAARASEKGTTQEADEQEQGTLARLVDAHAGLVPLVAPTKPRALLLFTPRATRRSSFGFPDSIPLVKHLTMVSILGILLFAAMSTISGNDKSSLQKVLGITPEWLPWVAGLLTLAYYLTAAGLGASFKLLFEINGYIINGTFDPKYVFSYWMRLTLGLSSGFILATLIPTSGNVVGLTNGLLALLGGYSAHALERILARLVEGLEDLVKVASKDSPLAPEQPATVAKDQLDKLELAPVPVVTPSNGHTNGVVKVTT